MTDWPIRQKSANGHPPPFGQYTRRCHRCGACFLALAPGNTGERGLWADWRWFCSIECAPESLRAAGHAEKVEP